MATDTLLLLLGWLSGTLLIAGWGVGFCRLLGLVTLRGAGGAATPRPEPPGPPVPAAVAAADDARGLTPVLRTAGVGIAGWWVGFLPLTVFLQLWQLALPVGPLAWLAAAAVAAAGGWFGRETLRGWARWAGARPWLPLTVLGLAVALAVWVSAAGARGAEAAVVWAPLAQLARQWALPVGVANLSPVYGLQHGWTLVEAFFSVGPWGSRPGRVASGLVALPLAAAALQGVAALAADGRGVGRGVGRGGAADAPGGSRVAAGFQAGGWALLAGWAVAGEAGGPAPGVAAGALFFVACGELLRGSSSGWTPHRGERIDRLTLAALLAAAAAAAHPPLAVAAVPLALRAGWSLLVTDRAFLPARRSTRSVGIDHDLLPGAAARRRTVVVAAVAVGLPLVAWLLRVSWSTGRPLFPYLSAPLPVGWAVPRTAKPTLRGLLDAPAPAEALLLAAAPALLPAVLGVLAWLVWLAVGGVEGRHRRLAVLPLVLALGLSGALFLPLGASPVAAAAAVGSAALASGLVAVFLGRSGSRRSGRAEPGRALAGCLLAAAVAVAAVGVLGPAAPGDAAPNNSAPGDASGEAPSLRGWSSAWDAEAAVPDGDRASAARAGLPGWTPMPAAAQPPPRSLRERERGDPSAGYLLDRRDPRSVIW